MLAHIVKTFNLKWGSVYRRTRFCSAFYTTYFHAIPHYARVENRKVCICNFL